MQPELLKLANLQLRRNFLKGHAEHFPEELQDLQLPEAPLSLEQNITDYTHYLEQQIQRYIDWLKAIKQKKPNLVAYIDSVLLERDSSASAGISRAVGNHFSQLQSQDEKRVPFGQLQEEGLCFYWQTPEDATLFEAMLKAHNITVTMENKILDASYLPEAMKALPAKECYQDEENTTVVRIPHCHVKQLLALAQYNPSELDTVLEDLYRGKTDRMSVLLEERKTNPQLMGADVSDALALMGETFDAAKGVVHVRLGSKAPSAQQEQTRPHFVFVLDDSGSMAGKKIDALNAAMRKLIPTLPDDALISIQPLNQPTITYRMTGKELKQNGWRNIPCPGGTPLLETIAGTATLVREHPLDVLISEAELARTIVVVLTDGQPNGGVKDTVAKLMSMMQEGVGYRKPANILPGRPAYADLSFGDKDIPSKNMPIVFGASIGAAGDTAFMQELAKRFGTPQGFIREEQIEQDLEHFLKQFSSLQGREKEATVAITYTLDSAIKTQQIKLRNLFHGFERQVFFDVPEGAQNIQVALINDQQFIAPRVCTVQSLEPKYMTEYLFDNYLALKAEFDNLGAAVQKSQSFEQSWDRANAVRELNIETSVNRTRRGGGDVIRQEQDYGADKAAWQVQKAKLDRLTDIEETKRREWQQLQEDNPAEKAYKAGVVSIEQRVVALLSMMPEDQQALTQEIGLFKNLLRAPRANSGYASVQSATGRAAIAQFSQLRYQGSQWNGKIAEPVSKKFNDLLEAIAKVDTEEVTKIIQQDPDFINGVDPLKGTALMTALYTWKGMREAGKDCTAIEAIFNQLLSHAKLNLLLQDTKKNSIAHKAAWWGMKDALLAVINEATKRKQLPELQSLRNTTHIGGTTIGERLFENILEGKLLVEEQEESIKALYGSNWSEASIQTQDWSLFTQPNVHFSPDGLTPLMVQLKWLRELNEPSEQAALRQKIMDYLQTNKDVIDLSAQSLRGNTALHFALYNEEYAIAHTILELAKARKGTVLNDVLFARNMIGMSTTKAGKTVVTSGGEVPYMNFLSKVQDPLSVLNSVTELLLEFVVEGTLEERKAAYELVRSTLDKDNPIESSILALEKLQAKYPTKAHLIAPILKKLEALMLFPQVYDFIHKNVDKAAKTEMGHLFTVYKKELEGYCAFNFLKQASVIKALGIKETLDTLTLPKELQHLRTQLDKFESTMDPGLAKQIQSTIDAYERNPSAGADQQLIQGVLTQAKILLAQQKHFVKMPSPEAQPTVFCTISPDALVKADQYLKELQNKTKKPGHNLQNVLNTQQVDLTAIEAHDLLSLLMKSRGPYVCAESHVSLKGETDWTLEEGDLLSQVAVHFTDTHAFNDGAWGEGKVWSDNTSPYPEVRISCVSGALLRNDLGTPLDGPALVDERGSINEEAYYQHYKNKLLPTLLAQNAIAAQRYEKLVINIPGIGCGQFAGAYEAQVRAALPKALRRLLKEEGARLKNIHTVNYDPYLSEGIPSEMIDQEDTIEGTSLRFQIRPTLASANPKAQLDFPANISEETIRAENLVLCKIVAWDPFSFPMNDIWADSRSTDEATIASTDALEQAYRSGMLRSMNSPTNSEISFDYDKETGCQKPVVNGVMTKHSLFQSSLGLQMNVPSTTIFALSPEMDIVSVLTQKEEKKLEDDQLNQIKHAWTKFENKINKLPADEQYSDLKNEFNGLNVKYQAFAKKPTIATLRQLNTGLSNFDANHKANSNTHRGFGRLPAPVRAALGVLLATVTVGLAVLLGDKHFSAGFKETFFGRPDTDTNKTLKELEKDIETGLNNLAP